VSPDDLEHIDLKTQLDANQLKSQRICQLVRCWLSSGFHHCLQGFSRESGIQLRNLGSNQYEARALTSQAEQCGVQPLKEKTYE
jgi:hypothetical protein